jgi:hypothetical protein
MGSNLNGGSFQVTLTEAGTAQGIEPPGAGPGAGNPQISSAVIRAMKGNGGTIYVGGAGVTSATGFELAAGDAVSMDEMGLGKFFFNGTKTGDKICVLWVGP